MRACMHTQAQKRVEAGSRAARLAGPRTQALPLSLGLACSSASRVLSIHATLSKKLLKGRLPLHLCAHLVHEPAPPLILFLVLGLLKVFASLDQAHLVRELERVAHQVVHDLQQAPPVRNDGRHALMQHLRSITRPRMTYGRSAVLRQRPKGQVQALLLVGDSPGRRSGGLLLSSCLLSHTGAPVSLRNQELLPPRPHRSSSFLSHTEHARQGGPADRCSPGIANVVGPRDRKTGDAGLASGPFFINLNPHGQHDVKLSDGFSKQGCAAPHRNKD